MTREDGLAMLARMESDRLEMEAFNAAPKPILTRLRAFVMASDAVPDEIRMRAAEAGALNVECSMRPQPMQPGGTGTFLGIPIVVDESAPLWGDS